MFALKFYEFCQRENSIYTVSCMLCLITHLKNKSLHGTEANTWNQMPDRGSDTANHMDHVHVSFTE